MYDTHHRVQTPLMPKRSVITALINMNVCRKYKYTNKKHCR